jgi:hypothetical protein
MRTVLQERKCSSGCLFGACKSLTASAGVSNVQVVCCAFPDFDAAVIAYDIYSLCGDGHVLVYIICILTV